MSASVIYDFTRVCLILFFLTLCFYYYSLRSQSFNIYKAKLRFLSPLYNLPSAQQCIRNLSNYEWLANNTFFHFVSLILGLENADVVQRLLIGDVSFKMRQSSRNYLGKKSRDLKWNQQYNLKRKFTWNYAFSVRNSCLYTL